MNRYDHYARLAALFDYPKEGYRDRVQQIRDSLARTCPAAVAELDKFLNEMPAALQTVQELFTRSFEVQAVTTLDVGYLLFGDDYKRGQILANLAREHREAANDCGDELADHLPNVLRLMALLQDEALRREMGEQVLGPAVRKMISEFEPGRVAQKNRLYEKHYKTLIKVPATARGRHLFYRLALKALFAVLKQDFAIEEWIASEGSNDFLHAVTRENQIEQTAQAAQYDRR